MTREPNLEPRCTKRALIVLRRSIASARARRETEPTPKDFLQALLREGGVAEAVLSPYKIPREAPSNYRLETSERDPSSSVSAVELMRAAEKYLKLFGHRYVGSEHLLVALTELHPGLFSHVEKLRGEIHAIFEQPAGG